MQVGLSRDSDCRICYWSIEEKQLEAWDGGYHGTGNSGAIHNDCKVAESCSLAFCEEYLPAGLKFRQSYLRMSPRLLLKLNGNSFEVECVGYGKAHKHNEFGVKVGF